VDKKPGLQIHAEFASEAVSEKKIVAITEVHRSFKNAEATSKFTVSEG
jgi:hypothetical protein